MSDILCPPDVDGCCHQKCYLTSQPYPRANDLRPSGKRLKMTIDDFIVPVICENPEHKEALQKHLYELGRGAREQYLLVERSYESRPYASAAVSLWRGLDHRHREAGEYLFPTFLSD